MNNTYLNQYKKNEVETATPEQILILLYDGAIRFLIKAKQAMADKNIQETHNNLISCENIILEFMSSLDMENGGDLAQRLYSLYDYYYNTLVQANMEKNVKKVDYVLAHLKDLRTTWSKAINIANAEKTQNPDDSLVDEDTDTYEKDDEEEA
ncbi:flagellar export chaperone FliS [bacterium]|nr:flagellar export chaperone FliS [bacterium]